MTNEDVGIFEIISPVRPDLSGTADVPDVQLETLALDAFYIETLCRSDLKENKNSLLCIADYTD